uniref:Uncharacterized protein n=1 Tax=Ditylenchus dipsaci TaxID=166011 RepID=A0A915EM44_9BILA
MDFDPPRIALIGEPGVGKTCLVNRFVNNTFDEQFTCRHQFVTKDVIIGNIPANIYVWDDEYPEPPGGPDHRKLYLSKHCCALTFDVTNTASFEALDKWRARCLRPESISERGDLPIVVLANKIDDTANRVVTPAKSRSTACLWAFLTSRCQQRSLPTLKRPLTSSLGKLWHVLFNAVQVHPFRTYLVGVKQKKKGIYVVCVELLAFNKYMKV